MRTADHSIPAFLLGCAASLLVACGGSDNATDTPVTITVVGPNNFGVIATLDRCSLGMTTQSFIGKSL